MRQKILSKEIDLKLCQRSNIERILGVFLDFIIISAHTL